jgi:hypothetical protein
MNMNTKRWAFLGLDVAGLLLFWAIFGTRYLPWAAIVLLIALVPALFRHR